MPQLNSMLIYYAIIWFRFIKIAAKVYFIWFKAQVNLNNISATTKKISIMAACISLMVLEIKESRQYFELLTANIFILCQI